MYSCIIARYYTLLPPPSSLFPPFLLRILRTLINQSINQSIVR